MGRVYLLQPVHQRTEKHAGRHRTANSRRLVVARESSKLATLAQTSSSTNVTAPSSANAAGFSYCALMSFQVCALSCQPSYIGNSL